MFGREKATRLRSLVAGLGALVMGVACVQANAQTEINVGMVKTADSIPLLISEEKGFFDAHGLDVTLTPIAMVTNAPGAILSGSIQIGAGTLPALLQTNEAGFGLVALSGVARSTPQSNPISLLARDGAGIETAADLVGKKVGVPGLNAIMHLVLQKWLDDNGVDPESVTWVEAIFPAMGDLLKGGQLDAVAVLEPFRSHIVNSGAGYKLSDYMVEVNDNMVMAAWMAKGSWAEENPDAVAAFLAAYQEAIDWALEHEDEVKQIEADFLGVASPIRPTYDLNITVDDLELFVEMGSEYGLLREPVDVETLIWK